MNQYYSTKQALDDVALIKLFADMDMNEFAEMLKFFKVYNIDFEDDTEFSLTEGTSSQEQEYTIEDMLSALDESIDDDDEECVSDEILDKFDKTLEEKGLGDDYFRKKEERLKEMELEHELHEFAIDEMLNE
jgi:hypothetical protein